MGISGWTETLQELKLGYPLAENLHDWLKVCDGQLARPGRQNSLRGCLRHQW
jgi:hypothetical protein